VLPCAKVPGRSLAVTCASIDHKADVGLLHVAGIDAIPSVALEAWDPNAGWTARLGEGVVSSGAPAEWKAEPDLTTRTIRSAGLLHYWSAIIEAPAPPAGLVASDVNARDRRLPRSFAGMSGGPVFSLGRKLVGVLTSEVSQGTEVTRLNHTRLDACELLLEPFESKVPGHAGYTRVMGWLKVDANWLEYPDDRPFAVALLFEKWRSTNLPDHVDGRLGRVLAAVIQPSRLPAMHTDADDLLRDFASIGTAINIEHVFPFPGDEEQDWRPSLDEGADAVLRRLGLTRVYLGG
jgi:hypothetical protein